MIEKRGKVTESIYSGSSIIPLANVSHIEKRGMGNLMVVLAGTTWCKEMDEYHNAVFISASEADQFKKAWCDYRAELERDSLMDIVSPEGMFCRTKAQPCGKWVPVSHAGFNPLFEYAIEETNVVLPEPVKEPSKPTFDSIIASLEKLIQELKESR